MATDLDWRDRARSDAWGMVENFDDEIIAFAVDGNIPVDVNNDYPGGDSYHHEMHIDGHNFSLKEAAEVLEELDEFLNDDAGLWEGQSPRDAIQTQAAYTYGAAVFSFWCDEIEIINDCLDAFAFEDDEWEEFVRRWVPAYIWLKGRRAGDCDGMTARVLAEVRIGEFTGCLALADRYEEMGREYDAARLRAWGTARAPEPEPESDRHTRDKGSSS